MSVKPELKTLRFFFRMVMGLLSVALVFGTAIPFLRSDAWWIRVFDFPRMQIAALIVLTLAGYAVLRFWARMRPWEYALAAVVGLALFLQLFFIIRYTALYPDQMSESRAEDNSNRISLLVYNVLADNREVAALRKLIRDNDPDIILLSEPNRWWLEQLDGLEADYPYRLTQPQENYYGKLLFSRLDPRPPGLKRRDGEESEREDSDMRDAELLLVAKEVKKLGDVPVIVAGDFNDVAWSHTTRLFQRIGGLLDPRVGRGLFNTFSTESFLMRYPLDHVFASEHFHLVELRRLPDIGSDHFPMLVVLDYDPGASLVNEEPQPKTGDEQEAEEAIDKKK
jgi:endonuclease/exonuclease/phosphatase (EEP) superfamily protein YafD